MGSREDLAEVWDAFYVDPVTYDHEEAGERGRATVSPPAGGVDALRQDLRERHLVNHSAPVYLIDREGVMRVVFTPPLDPDAIAHDARLLLD